MLKKVFSTKDSTLNFVYSFGASIVILGALFKLNHWHIGPFTGTVVLALGLVTEAIIFLIFAFDVPKQESHYAWENVYPELLDKEYMISVSKADLLDDELKSEISAEFPEGKKPIFFSGVTGEGLMELKDAIWKKLHG